MSYKQIIIQILIILLVVYVASAAFLYFNQTNIVYYPSNQDFRDCAFFSPNEIKEHNGTRFYHQQKNTDSVTIVYHGNAGRACERIAYRDRVGDETSLVLVEYAGYAGDGQRPSKNKILQDAANMVNWLETQNYTNTNIIGESLGSSVASYHASLKQPKRLILIVPFYSMKSLANDIYPIFPASLLLKENYATNEYLQNYTGRVLIIHGTADAIIDSSQSEKLRDMLEETATVRFVEVEGAGHNDIAMFPIVQEEFDNFIMD